MHLLELKAFTGLSFWALFANEHVISLDLERILSQLYNFPAQKKHDR